MEIEEVINKKRYRTKNHHLALEHFILSKMIRMNETELLNFVLSDDEPLSVFVATIHSLLKRDYKNFYNKYKVIINKGDCS